MSNAPVVPLVSQQLASSSYDARLSVATQQSISNVLNKWVESFRRKDTTAHIDCYGPILETYFRLHNVSKEQLRSDKEKAFATIADVRNFDVSAIEISGEQDGRVVATFHKDWDTVTIQGKTFAGSEIEKLTFKNYSNGWKIVKEEEIKILHLIR